MRFPRIKPDTHSFYHCTSRVVEGRFIFALHHGRSVPAEKIIAFMRRLEAFSGVRVLDYVIMSNHFHLVCEVSDPRPCPRTKCLSASGPSTIRGVSGRSGKN
jgi:putative transposase